LPVDSGGVSVGSSLNLGIRAQVVGKVLGLRLLDHSLGAFVSEVASDEDHNHGGESTASNK